MCSINYWDASNSRDVCNTMDLDKRLATAGMSTPSQTPETVKTPAKARTRAKAGTPAKQEYQERYGRHQQLRQRKHKVRQDNVVTSFCNTAVRELSVWVCTEFIVTQT
jgi:hypothetical protein